MIRQDIVPKSENSTSDMTYYVFDDGTNEAEKVESIRHDGEIEKPLFFHEVSERLSKLKSVQISRIVKRIDERAFCDCKLLTSVIFASDSLIEAIGKEAFFRCINLVQIDLPNNILEIFLGGFIGCKSLSTIKIPPTITRISKYCFKYCRSLSKVIIPPSVTHIEDYAFDDCRSLVSIRLPNGLQNIGVHAFSRSSLETIQVPPSTIAISNLAFVQCESLKVMYAPSVAFQANQNEMLELILNSIYESENRTIFLTDIENFEHRGRTSLSLRDIMRCINRLPDNISSGDHIVNAFHHHLGQRHPEIAKLVHQYKFNPLHLLIFFPGDIYQPLLGLLNKCPEAISAIDVAGRTPFHHVITSTKHNMNTRSYKLLSDNTPNEIIFAAIRSGAPWHEVHDIAQAKIHGLRCKDEESGLLPFMLAAVSGETPDHNDVVDTTEGNDGDYSEDGENHDEDSSGYGRDVDDDIDAYEHYMENENDYDFIDDKNFKILPNVCGVDLTSVYLLLSMQPDVLNELDVYQVSTNESPANMNNPANNDDASHRRKRQRV